MKIPNNWLITFAIILVIGVISLSSLSAFADTEDIYKLKRLWPALQQPWYFDRPEGITTDKQGNVYVVERTNHRIQKFTANGQFITRWGQQGHDAGQLYIPVDIAVDDSGNVYVADLGNCRIQKFTSNGQFISNWGECSEFDVKQNKLKDMSIAINSRKDMIYLAKMYRDHIKIQKFFQDGQLINQWEMNHVDGRVVYSVIDIAIDSKENVYVVNGNRVQQFTSDGNFIREWGEEEGSSNGQFKTPSGIAIDHLDNVYVADTYNDRIQKFTAEGQFITKWGKGWGRERNSCVFGLPGVEFGQCFLSRSSQRYGDGSIDHWTGEPGQFRRLADIAIDNQGNIYATDLDYHRIQKFTLDGEFIAIWDSKGTGKEQMLRPYNVALDSQNNVYVLDQRNHRVQKFNANGLFIMQWGQEGLNAEGGKFYYPRGIAIDASDQVYVADTYNKRIQKFTSDGQFLAMWETDFPSDITIDQQGNIYVVHGDAIQPNKNRFIVQKFNNNGKFITQWEGEESKSNPEVSRGITVDAQGYVYVADANAHQIQKYSPDGKVVWTWGEQGQNKGQFESPIGIAVDKQGNIYVSDSGNQRIQKFTAEGEFITQWGGEFGSDPGQMSSPLGLAVATNGDVYVADFGNSRIQVFKQITLDLNNKAIVVAGGGPQTRNRAENWLWDATQVSANFVYRTLTYQGFTKETIYYLSSDTDLDLDNNGIADDIDADVTINDLRYAITEWAKNADNLVIYLIDHGGHETFQVNSTEILTAPELNTWLNSLQTTLPGKITLVYDACESGSFVSALKAPQAKKRVIITSSKPKQLAYFHAQGSLSFSMYFWTHIFNGLDIANAFDLASQSVSISTNVQTPLLDANANGIGNEPEDDKLVQNIFIGNGTVIASDAPIINEVSPPQTIYESNTALIYVNVTDTDNIVRVWAIVRPPNYRQADPSQPVLALPSYDLKPIKDDRYEANYTGFDQAGDYQLAIYARDSAGNTSMPTLTTVSVHNPLSRKAIIIAGGQPTDRLWPAIAENAKLAYDALIHQGYQPESIRYLSAVQTAGVFGTANLENIKGVITEWAQHNTQDVVLYLIGEGSTEQFLLNDTEKLLANDLAQWLNDLQKNITGKITVIYDGSFSGSFIPTLIPPTDKQRILVTSTNAIEPTCFGGDLNFSKFFWLRILNGTNVRDAFDYANDAIGVLAAGQHPQLDDNGDGVNSKDGRLAREYYIGSGILRASIEPQLGTVSPEHTLNGETSAPLWVDGVATTSTIEKVWAVVILNNNCLQQTRLPLKATGDNRYEGTFDNFINSGNYDIAIYAMDDKGNISLPRRTRVRQLSGIAALLSSQTIYHNGDRLTMTLPVLPVGQAQYLGVELPDDRIFLITEKNRFIPFDGISLPAWNSDEVAVDLPINDGIPRGEYTLYLLRLPVGVEPMLQQEVWKLGITKFNVQ